jgi:hypothetical protein
MNKIFYTDFDQWRAKITCDIYDAMLFVEMGKYELFSGDGEKIGQWKEDHGWIADRRYMKGKEL